MTDLVLVSVLVKIKLILTSSFSYYPFCVFIVNSGQFDCLEFIFLRGNSNLYLEL